MTIEERYELSCYEELTKLDDEKAVWLVRHNETGILYVKKMMQLYNRDVYLRLQRENIANVPKVILCVEDDTELVVIEEYIHGMSLEKMMERDGTFSENRVAEIMLEICKIVKRLHECEPPIIHRDIKPSNIMVSNDGVVKLIDFNAAKEFNYGQNEDTRLMGTRKFAAPEQYGFGQSDQRTDIYAMGVTMYYLLTKHFLESNLYHGRLKPVIDKCTDMNKDGRYQMVAELVKDLAGFKATDKPETARNDVTGIPSEDKLFTKHLYPYKERFPVGFRSGVLWKMIAAVYGYLCTFWVALTMTVTNADGTDMRGYPLWINRVGMLIAILGSIFFLGNYRNIRYQLPFMNHGKKWNWFMTCVYVLLFWFLVVLLVVLAGGDG